MDNAGTMTKPVIIPYGIGALPAGYGMPSDRDRPAGVPFVAVRPGTGETLRLNTADYPHAARVSTSLGSDADDFEKVEDYLAGLCQPWSRQSRAFLRAYFTAIAERIEAHRGELTRALASFEGLFTIEDWRNSAPLPLPRAHLAVPPQDLLAGTSNSFVEVEFAFLICGEIIALESELGSGLPSQARRLQGLQSAGYARMTYSPADIGAGLAGLLPRLLGTELDFWRASPPSGPFRPEIPEAV